MKKPRIRKKWIFLLALALTVFLAIWVVSDIRLRPTVLAMAEGRVKGIASKALNKAVNSIVEEIRYTDLVTVVYDDMNRITMIQANTIRMSQIASDVEDAAQSALMDMDTQELGIPLGSVIGGQFFSGVGPVIRIRVIPVGSISSEFISEFVSSGINQTKHTIMLEMEANVSIVLPSVRKAVTVTAQVPICETIIVGDVPDTYLNTRNEEGLLNLVP